MFSISLSLNNACMHMNRRSIVVCTPKKKNLQLEGEKKTCVALSCNKKISVSVFWKFSKPALQECKTISCLRKSKRNVSFKRPIYKTIIQRAMLFECKSCALLNKLPFVLFSFSNHGCHICNLFLNQVRYMHILYEYSINSIRIMLQMY